MSNYRGLTYYINYPYDSGVIISIDKDNQEEIEKLDLGEISRQLDEALKAWEPPKCDCGARVAKTTHAPYCSVSWENQK